MGRSHRPIPSLGRLERLSPVSYLAALLIRGALLLFLTKGSHGVPYSWPTPWMFGTGWKERINQRIKVTWNALDNLLCGVACDGTALLLNTFLGMGDDDQRLGSFKRAKQRALKRFRIERSEAFIKNYYLGVLQQRPSDE